MRIPWFTTSSIILAESLRRAEDWKEWVESRRGRSQGEYTADFRKVRNKDNDWLIDRAAQKKEIFSGIEGINTQDHAIQESIGPIVDRSGEHLVGTDRAIFAARRLLLHAAKSVEEGSDPPGVKPSYYRVRPVERNLPAGVGWREGVTDEVDGINRAAASG